MGQKQEHCDFEASPGKGSKTLSQNKIKTKGTGAYLKCESICGFNPSTKNK
jgi:hypothetical protein